MPSASRSTSKKKQSEPIDVVEPDTTLNADPPLSLMEEHAALLKAQKRVLPSRARRGGAGIGNCDIDLTIIDAQRRAEENKPIVPVLRPFLLVTDASLVPRVASPEPSTSAQDQSIDASTAFYQSYFDRPEVIRSFREQEIIETPVFKTIPDDAVGGRLRTRSGEEVTIDTSDAAYILRHRKFETFEKSQRRREKEKLQHEHHKLKNRIEQLRSMEAPAFGGKDIGESEKRRESMLATAIDLEERYRVLLPEPRHRTGTSRAKPQLELEEEHLHEIAPEVVNNNTKNGKLTIKIKRTPPVAADTGSNLADDEGPLVALPKHQSHKKRISLSKRNHKKKATRHRAFSQAPDKRSHKRRPVPTAEHPASQSEPLINGEPDHGGDGGKTHEEENAVATSILPPGSPSAPEITPSQNHETTVDGAAGDEADSSVRPRKRARRAVTVESTAGHEGIPATSHQIAVARKDKFCYLLRAAQRTLGTAVSRKTSRTFEPFGAKLPTEVEEKIDFDHWGPAKQFAQDLETLKET